MLNHPMRRKDRQIPENDALTLLKNGEYGILSLTGPGGEPYGVPLSYILLDGVLYFHCARTGRKIDHIRARAQGAFTVVGATSPVYAGNFSTYFESVMAFGPISEVTDPTQKRAALRELAQKYLPDHMDKADGDIEKSLPATAVYALQLEHVSGKAKAPPSA